MSLDGSPFDRAGAGRIDAAIGAGLYLMFRRSWSDDRMVTEGAL